MPGTITPLPIMLDEEDRKVYEKLEPPKSMVVRYGYQKLIAELPYDGDAKPGCGSKLVIRSPRGIELAEMLTSTCPNSACSKSVSRKQMLQFIENSGGKDFPFTNQGKVLRVASVDDMNEQTRLDTRKPSVIKQALALIGEFDLAMALVDVELLLGGERILFHYTADHWVDFRALVRRLTSEYQTRIEMHQVNAREEARLVADYERCGQYCCCKNFLKVLKPVSMRSAKVQKATLDPQKISGRCGRLMCCLRYEDQTYEDLRKRLPAVNSMVETEDGVGPVMNTQILTQLVLVRVGAGPPAAYPMENIRVLSREQAAEVRAGRSGSSSPAESVRGHAIPEPDTARPTPSPDGSRPEAAPPVEDQVRSDAQRGAEQRTKPAPADGSGQAPKSAGQGQDTKSVQSEENKRRRRRRRRRKRGSGQAGGDDSAGP